MYFGWNLGLEKGGTYGMAIATALLGLNQTGTASASKEYIISRPLAHRLTLLQVPRGTPYPALAVRRFDSPRTTSVTTAACSARPTKAMPAHHPPQRHPAGVTRLVWPTCLPRERSCHRRQPRGQVTSRLPTMCLRATPGNLWPSRPPTSRDRVLTTQTSSCPSLSGRSTNSAQPSCT